MKISSLCPVTGLVLQPVDSIALSDTATSNMPVIIFHMIRSFQDMGS